MIEAYLSQLKESMVNLGISESYFTFINFPHDIVGTFDKNSETFDWHAFLIKMPDIENENLAIIRPAYKAVETLIGFNHKNGNPTYTATIHRLLVRPFELGYVEDWVIETSWLQPVDEDDYRLPMQAWQVSAFLDEFGTSNCFTDIPPRISSPSLAVKENEAEAVLRDFKERLPVGVDFEDYRFTQNGTPVNVDFILDDSRFTTGDSLSSECFKAFHSYVLYMHEYAGSMVYEEDLRRLFVDPLLSKGNESLIARIPVYHAIFAMIR